ncbi:MAG: GNAT family N-acetyltransferase [Gammaproteobacteria bacterium]|nr:GNAT family N-acetyltransferase [Gammaproteobacteria bacterium]
MKIALETERLILKFLDASDLDNLIALRSDPDVMKYLDDGSIHTEEKVKDFLLNLAIPYQEKHGTGFFAVFEKESGHFIGQAGLFHLGFYDKQPDIELAYRLYKQYWGKGYATELAKALLDWGFLHLDISKIVAGAEPENIASQRVLMKSGFDCKGLQKWWNGREMFYYEIYKNDSTQLVPYEKQWLILAEEEIKILYNVLPKQHILDIQHVGSTAIPGMFAKPIIDIQIAVDSLPAIKQAAIDILKIQGYVYWEEDPDPEKMFFVKGMPPFGDKRTHHIHIIEPKAERWKSRILFRDYLIKHSDAAHAYQQLKIKLAAEHANNRERYTNEKTTFIKNTLIEAQKEFHYFTQPPHIIFLTGASGAGKTTLLNALKNDLSSPEIAYFHFDSIGVPTEAEMIKVYGSGSEWQKAMTYHWIKKIITEYKEKEYVILEGQVNLDFITDAFSGFNFHQYKIILLHCNNKTRHQRLQDDRNQPELVNDQMDSWAEFLRKQAINKNVMILDTSLMNTEEMINQFKQWMVGKKRI